MRTRHPQLLTISLALEDSQYAYYKPSGDQPLHLQLWFRESATIDVQQLIKDLEALGGDDKTSSSASGGASRQVAAPKVPLHPLRARYLGEWQTEGDIILVIAAHPDGTVTIKSPQGPPWDIVINNVRWESDQLRYDEYCYYTGPKDFATITNRTGNHPFSGVKNDMRLMLTDDPNRLRQSLKTVHTPQPIEGDLTRTSTGG